MSYYFESHITIEPVFDEKRDQVSAIAKSCGFKLADLLLKKRAKDTEKRSSKDTFMTAHSKDLDEIRGMMGTCVEALRNAGYKVWRYKIESVIVDSRINDEMRLL